MNAVRKVGKQIGACLAYLHRQGLVHGDLKPLVRRRCRHDPFLMQQCAWCCWGFRCTRRPDIMRGIRT